MAHFLRKMSGFKFKFTDVVALLCNTFCRFNFVSLMAKDQVRVISMPMVAKLLGAKLTLLFFFWSSYFFDLIMIVLEIPELRDIVFP